MWVKTKPCLSRNNLRQQAGILKNWNLFENVRVELERAYQRPPPPPPPPRLPPRPPPAPPLPPRSLSPPRSRSRPPPPPGAAPPPPAGAAAPAAIPVPTAIPISPPAIGLRTRFVDGQLAPLEIRAVKARHGCPGFGIVAHLDEAESLGLARELVL